MQFEITVEAARIFAEGFYEALLDGLPVDAALTAARLAVFGMPNWTEWATPVLYMRAPDGRIFDLSALPPLRSARQVQTSEKEAGQERLEALYTEALEAYYAARWDRAVEVLEEIVCLQADYRRAAPMLEDARRQHELGEGYARGKAAYETQEWGEAIQHLEAVVALDAGYRDAADRLQEARRQKELADLYADARQLHQAQRWRAAIQALERIQAIEPAYPDPDVLLDSARAALEAKERAGKLAALYGQGLQHIDAQEWSEALRYLEQVAGLEREYRETEALLARVRRELQAQERARDLAEHYARGSAAYDAQDWVNAIRHLEAVVALDAGYRDAASRLREARSGHRVPADLPPATPRAPSPTAKERKLPNILTPRKPFEPEMVLIPAGEFLMSSDPARDKDAQGNEQPQHTLTLPDYYLARTPVTNEQYLAFVQESGQRTPTHWKDGKPPGGEENHPVVNVNWHDALAYCRWLAQATGRAYTLPSEAEWEKGARGTDGRIYPWGNKWDAARCNSIEGGKGDTTPVGAYPNGASPYGLLDMAGNVWEWTRTLWGPGYPYVPNDGREDLNVGGARVVRGGSFYDTSSSARCAFRNGDGPDDGWNGSGFRVVSPISP